jgi:hypothetical protein
MHIERFLRDSRAYLRVSSVASLRRDLDGHGQLWRRTGSRTGQPVQRNASIASLWMTSQHNISGTSWPA